MTEELDVEIVEEKEKKNHFDDLSKEQYVRYCIFEEYIRSEWRGEASIRLIDQIYEWVMDKSLPIDPKKPKHLKEVT